MWTHRFRILRSTGFPLILAGLGSVVVPTAPLYAQLDLEATVLGVEGALSFDGETAVIQCDATVTIRFTVAHVSGTSFPGGDEFNTTADVPPAQSNVLRKQTMTSDSESVPCSLAGCTGTINSGQTITFTVTSRAEREGSATFTINTQANLRTEFNLDNNVRQFTVVVVDEPQTDRIEGTVFFDLDGNGVQDVPDEQGLEGQVVYVDINANGFYDVGTDTSNVTISDGTFDLETPPVGESVTVGGVLTDGWEWTVPADGFQTVGEGGAEGIDFGTRPRNSAILGAVWDDVDGNGQVDPGEPRIQGTRVYADLNENGMFDDGEPSDVSNGSGLYVIPNLAAGSYVVRQMPRAGFVQTFPQDAYAVTLGAREFARGRNFGNMPLGSIHGQVFDDADGDSTRAAEETGLDSVPVVLRDSTGALVDSTTTMSMDLDGDGMIDPTTERGVYWFENLNDGEYTVEMRDPDGFRQTSPDSETHDIVLGRSEGRTVRGLDFGATQLGLISGWAYRRNYDIFRTGGAEWRNEGLNDVIIELVDAETGQVVDVTSTKGTYVDRYADPRGVTVELGEYKLRVPPGKTYIVRAVDPDGWVRLHPDPNYTVTVAPGEIKKRLYFYYRERRENSISGRKFVDPRGYGRYGFVSSFATGLNGWTIRIAGLDNGVRMETTTTDVDVDGDGQPDRGGYRFDGLPDGTYLVTEVEQPGFRKTFPSLPFYTVVTLGAAISRVDFANQVVDPVTVNDGGSGDSLRAAIDGCNMLPLDAPPCKIQIGGQDGGGGKHAAVTIRPDRPLPPITRPAVIDGGGDTILDGTDAGPGAHGLVVTVGRTDIRGLTITGFSGDAIRLEGPGANLVEDNTLTGNGGAGIRVASDTVNVFTGNVITANGRLPIDLGEEGPTPNDADETDGVPNYPVITAVMTDTGLVVEGTFASRLNTLYRLEFFAGTTCTPNGRGEAAVVLGTLPVVADTFQVDEQGRTAFTARFDTTFAEANFITATATHPRGRTSELSSCTSVASTTALDPAEGVLPAVFRLHPNYPNPFNPETTIGFSLPEPAHVRLRVFDVLGRLVTTLLDTSLTPGPYRVVFDARSLPSGSYLYRLEAGTFTETRRMLLLK